MGLIVTDTYVKTAHSDFEELYTIVQIVLVVVLLSGLQWKSGECRAVYLHLIGLADPEFPGRGPWPPHQDLLGKQWW